MAVTGLTHNQTSSATDCWQEKQRVRASWKSWNCFSHLTFFGLLKQLWWLLSCLLGLIDCLCQWRNRTRWDIGEILFRVIALFRLRWGLVIGKNMKWMVQRLLDAAFIFQLSQYFIKILFFFQALSVLKLGWWMNTTVIMTEFRAPEPFYMHFDINLTSLCDPAGYYMVSLHDGEFTYFKAMNNATSYNRLICWSLFLEEHKIIYTLYFLVCLMHVNSVKLLCPAWYPYNNRIKWKKVSNQVRL